MEPRKLSKIYYFGYSEHGGHGYSGPRGAMVLHDERELLIPGALIDTGFCPKTTGYEDQGIALMRYHGDWTVMSFWDRSGDKRHQSNSNFIYRGKCSFDEMCALAKLEFPDIWKRFTFPIVLQGWVEDPQGAP